MIAIPIHYIVLHEVGNIGRKAFFVPHSVRRLLHGLTEMNSIKAWISTFIKTSHGEFIYAMVCKNLTDLRIYRFPGIVDIHLLVIYPLLPAA